MEIISVTPKCGMCQSYYTPEFRRNGVAYKTCRRCLDLTKSKQKCEHGRERCKCRECGGGSQICEHDRQRPQCRECGGGSICQHGRIRSTCRECGGSQICEHSRRRAQCRECGDEIHKSVLQMIISCRRTDKKSNRYNDANHVTYEHVTELITLSENKCCYCKVELQFITYSANMGTIERIDNTIGHIVGNCMIACRTCNFSRVGDKSLLR